MTTKQKGNALPANNLDGHQISWSACLGHKVVLRGLVGQYMRIVIFHLVTLARWVNSYEFLAVSEQIWTSSALILELVAMKSGMQATYIIF